MRDLRWCGHWPAPHFFVQACGVTVYDPEPTPECTFVAFDGRAVARGEQ